MMDVLVIGSGGREHAIAWRLSRSPSVGTLHAAPGSAAICRLGRCHPVAVEAIDDLVALAQRLAVDLVVIGPEAPLVLGLADRLRSVGIATVGPSAAAAELEGSKAFAKDVMVAAGVPTAAYGVFSEVESALAYLARGEGPIVVKADGLAAGKGVVVCAERGTARAAVKECFSGRFGAAGARVVIEEFLVGQELSFIALCDGQTIVPLASSQDHKRLSDGDLGPNTGGMGAFSPSPLCDAAMTQKVVGEVMAPVLAELKRRGIAFNGFLYAGLMVDGDDVKVLEFNVRCGDPETQVLMARFTGDLGRWLAACAAGRLSEVLAEASDAWDERAAVAVVLASRGYPLSSEKGVLISGADGLDNDRVTVFHAGTRAGCEGWETAGGRVLAVTALGAGLDGAAATAYEALAQVTFDGMQFRRDIGRTTEG
jgi:phosphoribosylamine--glycine ligase